MRGVVKSVLGSLGAVAAVLLLSSCGDPHGLLEDFDADVTERVPGTNAQSWENAAVVATHLNAAQAVRINVRTNHITYYENGKALAKWKVASARTGKSTPRGIFQVHSKQSCPSWTSATTGQRVSGCASNNPLGKKALWFHQGAMYGMHGVDQANLISVTAANPRARDRSSGCVRNHPSNIEWLYAKARIGMPVVVGAWDTDPSVRDCSGNGDACGSGSSDGSDSSLLPATLPSMCAMNVSANAGVARIRAQANTSSSIVAELKRDNHVKVHRKVSGAVVSGSADWYFVTFTQTENKEGYIHSSLLDCRR